MLQITNGDAVIGKFEEMGLEGQYLAWRDVLHEGPVPQTATLAELDEIRARFIAGCGWGPLDGVRATFAERRTLIEASRNMQEVVLWFEYDLYDHLQLIQILHWYHANRPLPPRVSLLLPEAHLSAVPIQVFDMIYPLRNTLDDEFFELGAQAWDAFRAPDPRAMLPFLQMEEPALVYLPANTRRLLEEYPWTTDGLSRSARQLLQAAAQGLRDHGEIFEAASAMEEARFMGDSSAFALLDQLTPLALTESGEVTRLGHRLLAGEADWIAARGGIDTWIGGVHLHGSQAQFRWDPAQQTIISAI
ncbi:MAG: hypothetical protein JNK87_26760 [Bryobacterales bacterium]|nr:hypothetical protein [Bryobacterales bacterium]